MSLAPFYVKAAAGAVLPGRGTTLPGDEVVRDVTSDLGHLTDYVRVCGFTLTGTLPVTYPHLLGFGLQLGLMTRRSFPLALPGSVHIRNTISTHRPIDAGEPLRIAVHAERFAPHPRGAQVDLVTEVAAAGEPVWTGRSTYLSRGATAPVAAVPARDELPGVADAAVTAVWRVPGDTGRRYAAVSGDVNPIHLHPLTARAFGFPTAIAHGMWTAARALAALQGRIGDALTYDVEFRKPLRLPSTVELRSRAVPGGWDLGVGSRSGVEHLRATVRAVTP